MKLSVIITTYNSEEWLKKVLFGYLNQTETDFEVVVADDGSTEKTKLVLIPSLLNLNIKLFIFGKKTKDFRSVKF